MICWAVHWAVGIRSHVEVNDLPPIVPEHDENVQHAKRDGRNSKEVAGSDVRNVIVEERSPSLRRWLTEANHVLGHRPLGDLMSQEKQLRADSWRTPSGILPRHPLDQLTDVARNGRPSRLSAFGTSNSNTT